MPFSHLLLVVCIMAIWGFNFVAVKIALQQLTPLSLCFLRFLLASFPAVFFIKPPKVPIKMVFLYALFMFVGQFSLLFISMKMGTTAGLAAILLQMQLFFTIVFAVLLLNEKLSLWQLFGSIIALSGIAVVTMNIEGSTSFIGLLLVITGAASWGLGNIVSKKMYIMNMTPLVIWGSLISCPIFFLLALIFEGYEAIKISVDISHLSTQTLLGVLYIVYGSTLMGYSGWTWLLSKYPVTKITPFTLLAPIFAMLSSWLVLHEPLESWKITAGVLVISGICINIFGARSWSKVMSYQARALDN